MIVQHFIGNNGFEACIEQKKNLFRVGWKSPKANDFTFVCCKFQSKMKVVNGWKHHQKYNLSAMTPEKERKSTWTTYSAASKRFNEMIKNHNKVNFK